MILKIRDSSFEAYKSRLERIKRDPNSTTKELKDIVDRRKEITKKLKELTKDTSKMDRKEFWYKFTDIFDAISQRVDGIDNYSHFDNIDKIPDTDNIKMRLMSRFNDKTIKRIKTNINIPGRVFFDGIHNSYEVVNNVSFEVITDLPIDFNRVYTRKEVLDLYNTKKIFFKNMRLDTTNEKINSSSEFLDFYGCKNELEMPHCLCGGTSVFPAWYEQPLTIEIIRRSGDMKSQIATLTEQYITQNKILAKEIKVIISKSLFFDTSINELFSVLI